MIAAGIAALVLLGGGIAFALGSGSDSGDRSNEGSSLDGGGAATFGEDLDAIEESTTTITRPPTSTTTTTEPPERRARLYSGDTRVRDRPSLDASPVAVLTQREGMDLTVLSELTDQDGWYRVRLPDGVEGYLFGAFVLPPTEGYCVGTAPRGVTPRIYDDRGSFVSDEATGNKVLIASPQPIDGQYRALSTEGTLGWVDGRDLDGVDCR